ncbi:MAG: proteasome ATPase, partial [Acidimicrobiia bacterium]|nr:proteasome ATPase [Acidimicrobiia bacterium]
MDERRIPDDAVQLRRVIQALEEEVSILRRRASGAPEKVRELESELERTKERFERASDQNDKLAAVLEEARQQLGVLREEVDKLTAPPNNFGSVLQVNVDGTIDVLTGSRKLRVAAQPSVEVKELQVGQEVILNEAFNIIDVRDFEPSGDVVRVREVLGDKRVVIIGRSDEESVLNRSDVMADAYLRPGDYVRIDNKTKLILEKMERPEVEELVLEEVPDVTYSQ